MAGYFIYFAVFGLTAFIMIGIGVSQLKSKEPVGFYTGVKPPEKRQLRDVKAWNRKHGVMWILYGGCIIACSLATGVVEMLGYDAAFLTTAELVVLVGGVFVMMLYHARLERLYRIS